MDAVARALVGSWTAPRVQEAIRAVTAASADAPFATREGRRLAELLLAELHALANVLPSLASDRPAVGAGGLVNAIS